MRADVTLYKSARALAAWEGNPIVAADDVHRASELVLPHRRRPSDSSRSRRENLGPSPSGKARDEGDAAGEPRSHGARFEPNASSPEKDRAESGDETGPEAPSGRVAASTIFRAAASGPVLPIRIAAAQAEEKRRPGRRNRSAQKERGRMFGPFLTPIRPSSLSMRRSVLPRPVVSTRRDESTFSGPIGIAKSGRAVRTP